MSWASRLVGGSRADSTATNESDKRLPVQRPVLLGGDDELFVESPAASNSSCLEGTSRTGDHFSWLSNNINSGSRAAAAAVTSATGMTIASRLKAQTSGRGGEAGGFRVTQVENDKKFNSYHRGTSADKSRRLGKPAQRIAQQHQQQQQQCVAGGLAKPAPAATSGNSEAQLLREAPAMKWQRPSAGNMDVLLGQHEFTARHGGQLEPESRLEFESSHEQQQEQQLQGQQDPISGLEFARSACFAPSGTALAASLAVPSASCGDRAAEASAGRGGATPDACKRSEPMHMSAARRLSNAGASSTSGSGSGNNNSRNNNNNNNSSGDCDTRDSATSDSPDANANEEHFQEALSCDDAQFGSTLGFFGQTGAEEEEEQQRQAKIGSQYNQQQRRASERHEIDKNQDDKQAGELVLVSKSAISDLSDQIAFSLNKMKDLEEQVSILPHLQRQLEHMSSSNNSNNNDPTTSGSNMSVDSLGYSTTTTTTSFYDPDDSGTAASHNKRRPATSGSSGFASQASSQRYLATLAACKCSQQQQHQQQHLRQLGHERHEENLHHLSLQRHGSGAFGGGSFAKSGQRRASSSAQLINVNNGHALGPLGWRAGSGQLDQHGQQQRHFGQTSAGEASSSSTLNDHSSRLDYEDLLDDLLSLSRSVNSADTSQPQTSGSGGAESPIADAAAADCCPAACDQPRNQRQNQHRQAFGIEPLAARCSRRGAAAALISAAARVAAAAAEPVARQRSLERLLQQQHGDSTPLRSQTQFERQSEQVSETANIAASCANGNQRNHFIANNNNNNSNNNNNYRKLDRCNLACRRVSPNRPTKAEQGTRISHLEKQRHAQQQQLFAASGARGASNQQYRQTSPLATNRATSAGQIANRSSGRQSSSPSASTSTPTTPTNNFCSRLNNNNNARAFKPGPSVNRTLTRSRDNQLEFIELAATNRNSSTSNISQILSGLASNYSSSNNQPSNSASTGLLLKSHTRSNSMILDQPSKHNHQDTTGSHRPLATATNSYGRATSQQHKSHTSNNLHHQRQPSGSASLQASPVRSHLDCGCQSIREHLKYNTMSRESRLNGTKSQTLATSTTGVAPTMHQQQISITSNQQPKSNNISNKTDAATNTDLAMADIITSAELHQYLAKINGSSRQQHLLSSSSLDVQAQLGILKLKETRSSQVCLSSSTCHKSSGGSLSSSSQAASSCCSSESDDAYATNINRNLAPRKALAHKYNGITPGNTGKHSDIHISTDILSSSDKEVDQDNFVLPVSRGETTNNLSVIVGSETTDRQSEEDEEEACSHSGAVEPFSLGSSYQDPSDFEEYYAYEESLAKITRNIKSQAPQIPETFRLALAKLSDHFEQTKCTQQPLGQSPSIDNVVDVIRKAWFEVAAEKESPLSKAKVYIEYIQGTFTEHLLKFVVNLGDNAGNTVTHYAASHFRLDIIKLLLATKVCDVNKRNKAGYTPIMLLALVELANSQDQDIARQLFSRGDVNIKSRSSGQTALMLAASHGRLETCKLLLECGANPSLIDYDGSTALMCGSEIGNLEVVECLLANPLTNPTATDNDGLDALQIAMNNGHHHIGMVLYEANKTMPQLPTENDRQLGGSDSDGTSRTTTSNMDSGNTASTNIAATVNNNTRLGGNNIGIRRNARNGDTASSVANNPSKHQPPSSGYLGASLRRRRCNTANTYLKRADSLAARVSRPT